MPMILRALLICALAVSVARGAEIPLDRFYPVEATLVPVAEREQLQRRLDAVKTIRLEQGDYRTGSNLHRLTLRSGQRIYGLSTSIIPDVVVEPGCTGALLSGVVAHLRFPPSDLPTRDNVFRRITYGSGVVDGAVLIDNLFLDLAWFDWRIDVGVRGSLRGNRFIRQVYQALGDACTWIGNSRTPTTGNVLLWTNFLTPPKGKFDLRGLGDTTILNYDCEGPGSDGSPAIKATDCDRLVVFSTTGTNRRGPAVDAGARRLWLHGSLLFNQESGAANVVLRDDVGAMVQTLFDRRRILERPAGKGTVLRAFQDCPETDSVIDFGDAGLPIALDAAKVAAVLDVIAPNPAAPAWPAPTWAEPPPAKPDLPRRDLGRAGLQALIDRGGVVVLEPGIYTLDGPLRLGKGRGLVGAGMERTILSAANPTINLIEDDGTGGLFLTDLTLQGGRNGIFHADTVGKKVQFVNSVLSHVCIRSMSESGFTFTDIFGYDNNCFDHVIFADCPAGFRQIATRRGDESDPHMCYMDKCLFYRCQWLRCGTALDFTAFRSSGGNCWVECRFIGSTKAVTRAQNHSPMLFANCDLLDNAGNPMVAANGNVLFTNCRFTAGTVDPVDLVDGISVTLEGCTMVMGGAKRTVLTSGKPAWFDLRHPANAAAYANRRFFIVNSRIEGIPLGPVQQALFVNSRVAEAERSVRLAYLNQGRLTVLDPGEPTPGTRILTGAAPAPAAIKSGSP